MGATHDTRACRRRYLSEDHRRHSLAQAVAAGGGAAAALLVTTASFTLVMVTAVAMTMCLI